MNEHEPMFDVVADDGRILNDHPLTYGNATLFSLDADIDSTETTRVVLSTRPRKPLTRRSRLWSAVLRLFGFEVNRE